MGRSVTVGLGAAGAAGSIAAVLAAAASAAPAPAASGGSSTFTPDYYISPSGSDSNNGTSSSTPWKTFNKAFTTMAAGTSLGLMDGTYSVAAGTGYISYLGTNSNQAPSGNSISDQTVVRAINPGSAKVTGGLFVGRSDRKDSYITFQGITFLDGGELYNTSYVTVKDCGFMGAGFHIGTNDHENGNTRNLIEDVWITATGQRLVSSNYRSDENVWRRVLVRGDGCGTPECTGSGNPNVGLTCYDSRDCSFQNVMVIDRLLLTGDEGYASFATAQHTSGSHLLGRNEWLGCMVINGPDQGFYFEADNVIASDPTWTLENCVAWATEGDGANLGNTSSQRVVIRNLTVGHSGGDGLRVDPAVSAGSVTNILSLSAGRYGVNSAITPTYCNVYGSGDSAYNQTTCTTGAYTYNAETDGSLEYVPRIEASSNLDGIGASGADIGANIVNRYGADGTRYGDSGYHDLTSTALWPWPNQTRIRQELGPDLSITRGFCASGKTLTSYVWEYLGNASPY